MLRSPVSQFFWRVFLWLPLCFAAWYYFGNLFMLLPNYLAEWFLTAAFPDIIASMTPQGSNLVVLCSFEPPASLIQPGMEAQKAQLELNMNMLKYGYSIPLYTALILASPAENEAIKWIRWSIGLLVLFLTTAWGISFDVMKTVLFFLQPEVTQYTQSLFNEWQLNAFALAYQFGYLILPAVTPLVLWVAFHRDFLAELIKDR